MILTSYIKIKTFGDCSFYFHFYTKNEKKRGLASQSQTDKISKKIFLNPKIIT